jgi:hypothetical protein
MMHMKKIILAIAALAFLAWGCSSDSDETRPTGIPEGTETRPAWTEPNYDLYEQTMSVDVLLQDTLVQYASEQDLLCATINNEVRGVATALQVDDQWLFPLTVASNEAGVMVGLSYYCDKLHRIFTINWTQFDASVAPTGQGGIYMPKFVE